MTIKVFRMSVQGECSGTYSPRPFCPSVLKLARRRRANGAFFSRAGECSAGRIGVGAVGTGVGGGSPRGSEVRSLSVSTVVDGDEGETVRVSGVDTDGVGRHGFVSDGEQGVANGDGDGV